VSQSLLQNKKASLEIQQDAKAGRFGCALHSGAAVLGQMADGAVLGMELGNQAFYFFDPGDLDKFCNQFAAQALVLILVRYYGGQFCFLR
jgi:hypothetical protein